MKKKTVAIAAGAFYLGSLRLHRDIPESWRRHKKEPLPKRIASVSVATVMLVTFAPVLEAVVILHKEDAVERAFDKLEKFTKGDN
jgi:hypothetical protein